MTIDIQALTREAGCTELGDCEEFWSEDEPAFVFRKDELVSLCNAVLEAAADACDQSAREQIMMATTALDDSERSVISRECAAAIRAMKATT